MMNRYCVLAEYGWGIGLVMLFAYCDFVMPALADEEVFREIIKVQSARERLYDNGHFVWKVEDVDKDQSKEEVYEFWSRDGKYFRLDRYVTSGDPTVNEIKRVLVSPNGFIEVKATDRDDPGVITAAGPRAEGLSRIGVESNIAQANRMGDLQQVRSLIDDWMNDRTVDVKTLKLTQNDAEAVILSYTREFLGGLGNYAVTMTPHDFRVVSWKYEFNRVSDDAKAMNEAVTVYGDEYSGIPIRYSFTARSTVGGREQDNASFISELVDYEPDPAPMSVFFLHLFPTSPTTSWFRRLLLFNLGVGCLVIYYLVRRRATPVTNDNA